MKAIELLEKYPEAAEVIVKYYSDQFTKSIENTDVPEEFKEFAKQQRIDDQYVADFIDGNPRGAFDVFDDNDLYIAITPIYDAKLIACEYSINAILLGKELTRREAETAVIEKAFEILNEKLCQTK